MIVCNVWGGGNVIGGEWEKVERGRYVGGRVFGGGGWGVGVCVCVCVCGGEWGKG